jgi:uncharacterized Zn finger protein
MSGSAEDTPNRDQFTIAIECPQCGKTGSSVWEENHAITVKGPQPFLISLSEEFYERISKNIPYEIELVCNQCGLVQLD